MRSKYSSTVKECEKFRGDCEERKVEDRIVVWDYMKEDRIVVWDDMREEESVVMGKHKDECDEEIAKSREGGREGKIVRN